MDKIINKSSIVFNAAEICWISQSLQKSIFVLCVTDPGQYFGIVDVAERAPAQKIVADDPDALG